MPDPVRQPSEGADACSGLSSSPVWQRVLRSRPNCLITLFVQRIRGIWSHGDRILPLTAPAFTAWVQLPFLFCPCTALFSPLLLLKIAMVVTAPQHQGQFKSIDVTKIKGNAPNDAKNYVYAVFRHLVGHEPWYNHEIGERLELREVNIWGDAGSRSAKAETIFEIGVTPGAPLPSTAVGA